MQFRWSRTRAGVGGHPNVGQDPPRGETAPSVTLLAATLLWVAVLACGLGILWRYQRTPGEAAVAPPHWPAASVLPHPAGQPIVLQFIHPRCPCSRASLTELTQVLDRLPTRPAVLVVFMRPSDVSAGWEQSDTWNRARQIQGATVLVDVEGKESTRFGAETSGQTIVYGPQGELLFSGGLTAARGELGSSAGGDRFASVLRGMVPPRRDSQVFGCPLHGNGQREQQ